MVNAELGTKRNCPSCAGRFYDLKNDPITCPLCGETFVVESILPSKSDGAAAAAPVPEPDVPKPVVEDPGAAPDDADKDDVDDEVAGIEDVDLGDDAEALGEDDADTFLETDDDDDDNVSDIVAPAAKGEEET